jgi:hypothetical protein
MMQHIFQDLKRLATPAGSPVATPAAITRNPAMTNLPIQMPPPTDHTEWIVLCLNHKLSPLMTLHEIQFPTAPTNAELFRRLANEYEQKREPYSLFAIKIRPFWREVKAIHFVRFTTLSPQPRRLAQIEEMHSLPLETHTRVYNRRNGINALVMARYLKEPSSVGEGWSVFDFIPKTRYSNPLGRKAGIVGWGLYMEEGVSRRSKLLCVVVVLSTFHLLGVWGLVWAKEALGIIVVGVNLCYIGGIVAATLLKND